MSTFEVDAKGMQCPGPIVEVFKTMNKAKPGDLINDEVTDFGFKVDIKVWCKKTCNELVSIAENGNVIKATLNKA